MKECCIEITDKCKQNCIHCSSDYGLDTEIPMPLINSVVKDFRDLGGKCIELSGGDPTEHSEFERVLEVCSRYIEQVSVFSNNTAYDNETLVNLLKKHNSSLAFTVLGIGDTHNRLSGCNSYEKIISLQRLCLERGVPTTPHFVLMIHNYGQLSEILDTFPQIKILRLMPQGRAWDNWDRIAIPDALIKKTILDHNAKMGSHLRIPFCYAGNCTAGISQFLITALGSVVPCASFKRYSVKLGNIYDQRLTDIFSDHNEKWLRWKRIKKRFATDTHHSDSLHNSHCWGDYLHGGMKHPLRYNKLLREFGVFDADFSRWIEHPHEKIYVIGAHGTGKSTLLKDVSKQTDIPYYENESRNPHREDVKMRQLWRLYKYKFDEERIKTLPNDKVLVCRCPLDWLIYTEAFRKLGWITTQEYDSLMKRYRQLFGEIFVPERMVYVNPPQEWSEKRIRERWESEEKKWREDDFDYYDVVKAEYEKKTEHLDTIADIFRLRITNRQKRTAEFFKVVSKFQVS